MTRVTNRGLLDTSVFVAIEQQRRLADLPDVGAVSAVTLAELHLGVLMANDPATRAQRLATLTAVERSFEVLPVDGAVAQAYGQIVAEARRGGRRPAMSDALIAATALANQLTVYSQDEGFRSFALVDVVII